MQRNSEYMRQFLRDHGGTWRTILIGSMLGLIVFGITQLLLPRSASDTGIITSAYSSIPLPPITQAPDAPLIAQTPVERVGRAEYAAGVPAHACQPISPLDCSKIVRDLPIHLTFDGNAGGLLDTGFTMVDPPSQRLAADGPAPSHTIPGFAPELLHLSAGRLTIQSTQGIQYRRPSNTDDRDSGTNTLLNALGVGIVADTAPLYITATLLKPAFPASANAEQAGIWFGLNDDNYVKLVIINGGDGKIFVQVLREVDGVTASSTADDLASPTFLLAEDVPITLILEIDRSTGLIRGWYQTIGPPTLIHKRGVHSLTLPATFSTGTDHDGDPSTPPISYAGLFASSRHGPPGMQAHFVQLSMLNK
jgi:hypothetical protein